MQREKREVISEQKTIHFRDEIVKIKGSGAANNKKRVIMEKGGSSIENDRKYSLALARIILAKDNPCACIKIEEEKIL